MNYPKEAKEASIQGRVLVGFDICEDGAIRNVRVLRGVHEALDAEAVRVISASPKWEPGMEGGKAVKVNYSFPVIFILRGGNEPALSITDTPAAPAGSEKMDEVVVVSYAQPQESADYPKTATIKIRGNGGADPVIYLDGKKFSGEIGDIDPSTISSIEVLKDEAAIQKYGDEAKNGVLLIKTK